MLKVVEGSISVVVTITVQTWIYIIYLTFILIYKQLQSITKCVIRVTY